MAQGSDLQLREIETEMIKRLFDEKAGFVKDVSDIIAIEAWKDPLLIPDLSKDDTLFLFADYSRVRGAYKTYSFLVVGKSNVDSFDPARRALRENLHLGARRMSFKGLNDKVKLRALPEFLSLAGALEGFVLTFAVSSTISYMFVEQFLEVWPELRDFKKPVLEDMLRIAHFGAQAILAGFTSRQSIFWFSDEDNIVANEAHQQQFGRLSEAIIRRALPDEEIGTVAFGLSGIDGGSLQLEDLLSISDLVAGAICETLDALSEGGQNVTPRIAVRKPSVGRKTDLIGRWIGQTENALKQFGVVFDRTGPGASDWRPAFFRIQSGRAVG